MCFSAFSKRPQVWLNPSTKRRVKMGRNDWCSWHSFVPSFMNFVDGIVLLEIQISLCNIEVFGFSRNLFKNIYIRCNEHSIEIKLVHALLAMNKWCWFILNKWNMWINRCKKGSCRINVSVGNSVGRNRNKKPPIGQFLNQSILICFYIVFQKLTDRRLESSVFFFLIWNTCVCMWYCCPLDL